MTTSRVHPRTAARITAARNMPEAVPLPLWKPVVSHGGYETFKVSVDNKWTHQTWSSVELTTVIAGWGIVTSRHLQTSNVVFGLIEGVGGSGGENVWPQSLNVQPEQPVQDYCASVERNRNDALGASDVLSLLGWPSGKQLLNTLVAVIESSLPSHTFDFWTNVLHRHHCSLLLVVAANQETPALQLVFDQAVYASDGIKQLGEQLVVVLEALTEAQEKESTGSSCMRVADVPWLSQHQRKLLLALATATSDQGVANEPVAQTLPEMFIQWCEQAPDQLAVVDGGCSVTYCQLSQYVHYLASALQLQHAVTRETRVAFLGQKSLASTVAVMATMLASGAIVPIDMQFPSDRVAYILHDSGCQVLLTTTTAAAQVPSEYQGAVVNVDDYCSVDSAQPASQVPVAPASQDLAYIIYTSGTTGRPKGVMVEYGCLQNVVADSALTECFQPGQVCLQFFSVSFDPHLFVLFSALTHGCTLRIMRDEDALDDFQSVDVATVTPSFLARVDPMSYPNVQTVIVTGEACPQILANKWVSHCTLANAYGPTETTIFCHAQWLSAGRPVDIGKPLANVSSYVVDRDLHLVPMGVIGELLIGGVGVARGYCNLPVLTAERFLPNPFGPGRVYRTGDLVRWLPDGNLEYIGRRDNQVKLNGFRIELEEVESVAGQCSQVQQAAVLVHRNHLVCFVTPELSDFAPLADHLRQKLPHYMVPHTLVALAQLPTTVNGKVDKRALADLDLDSAAHCSLVADSATLDLDTDTTLDTASDNAFADQEAVLCQAWAELLDVPVERIARQAHFFQLGGDSIVAILLVSKCRQQGYQLTVPTVYAHPVLASLARHLVPLHAATTNSALCTQTPVTGAVPLTPIQQWFFGLPLQNPHHFNQSFLLKLNPRVDANAIQDALVTLLTHHDMLRCRYTLQDSQWHQTIPTAGATHGDYCWAECHTTEAELSQHLAKLHTQLSLTQGPLLGALLVHLNDLPDQPRLYLVSHHIVIDLVSWRILIDDLNTLLSHQPLPPKTLSFAQWATSLDAHAATLTADCWPEQVSPTNATTPIPADQVGTRHSIFQTLDATITDQLVTHVCPALRITPRDAILSAYALAYCQALSTAQVNLCMEGHGREPWSPDLDISRTVGWFTSFYPLVIHAQTNASLAAVLHQAKERLQQIPTKGFLYFLLKYMANTNADERNQLLAKTPAHLDVLFNYFGRFTQSTTTDQSLVSIDWSDQYGEHDNPAEDWVPFDQYVMAMISGDTLRLGIDYNTRRCTDASMTTLLATWATHLRDLVLAFTANPTAIRPAVTRFDFDLLPLTSSDFDQLSTQLTQRNLSWHQVKDLYPCTPLQSGLLLSTLRSPHAYLVQYHVTLTGNLDLARLEASWQQVALHHSILRTVFLDAPSQVTTGYVQAVLTQSIVRFDADLTQSAAEVSTKAYQRLHTDFALDNPLFQVSVGALPNTTNAHQMTITFHHAMLDGWSFPLLMAEVLKCYEGNQELELTTSTFKDVAQHILCDRLTGSPAQFWQAYLANAPPTPAPLIHPQLSPTTGYKGYRAPLAVPKPALLAFVRAHGITLSTLLRGAYALALSRYLRTSDVVFGVIVSGRNVPVDGIAAVIGPCLNTVPFRVKTCDRFVIAWLQKIHHDYVQMIPYEQSGNVDIARWCRQPSDARLFNAVMGYENQPPLAMPTDSTLAVGGTTVEEYTEYPFSVAFEDQPDAVLCKVLWAQCMYSPGVGAGVVSQLSCILDQIMASSATTQLQSIRLHASKADGNRSSLLTSPSAPLDATAGGLRHAIEACCSDLAGVPVLVHAQQSYTWSTLATMAAMLDQRMREAMADSNRVAVAVVDSHLALVVSLLACIQYGASLVPISAKHPVGSINQLLDHLSPAFVLIPAALNRCLQLSDAVTQVILDDIYDAPLDSAIAQWPTELDHTPHSLAPAVQFIQSWDHTGVDLLQVPTVVLLQAWTEQPYLVPKGSRVMHSFALDSETALWTTIRALSQGCMLVDKDTVSTDDTPIMAYVTDSNTAVPLLPFRPAHIIRLVSLSMVGIGSISATSEQAVTIQLYATSVFAGHATLTVDQYKQCVAMGTLPSSLPFTVVDTDGYSCPVGVAGAVGSTTSGVTGTLASDGSYRAYSWWSTGSMPRQQPIVYGYRKGDSATLLAGTSQPHGSVDGVQVYPGLIHPFLRQVGLCPVYTTLTPASQLVVLVDNAEFDLSLYERELARVLPDALQPLAIMSTTVFPSLLSLRNEPQRLEAFATAYRHVLQLRDTLKPETEQWLAVHWIALGHAKCDLSTALTSSFWEIGGALADLVALRHCIRAKFNVALPIHDMYSHSHFAALCTLIDTHCNAKGQSAASTLQMTPVDGSWPVMHELPVTAAQLKVWCQACDSHSTGEWYYQNVYHTNAAIQVSTLRTALTWLIGAHDSLRTSFVEVDGQVRQRIHAKPMPSTKCPLVAIYQHDRIAEAEIVDVLNQHHASLRALSWPLVSIVVLTTSAPVPSAHVSMRLHPLIGDYTSAAAFGRDLWQCYDHLANGSTLESLCLPAQHALPPLMDETLRMDALAYWQQLTIDVPTTIHLPTDRYIRDSPTYQVQSVAHLLSRSTHAQLATTAAQANAEPFVLWLSLLSVYLARIVRQDELLVGVKLPAAWLNHSLQNQWPSHHASLLLHSHSKSHDALPDALTATQQQLDASLPHAAGSLEHLVQALGLSGDSLFASVPNVVVEFALPSSGCQSTLTKLVSPPAVTRRPFGPTLHLIIDLKDQSTNITAYYSVDQFSTELAYNLLANLEYFVSNVLADPNQLGTAPLTRPEEVATLVRDYARGPLCDNAGNASAADAVDNVVRLVQATANAHPTLPALEYGSHITTYRDLIDQATTVAASLQAHGVAVQSRVAVLVENHPSTIVMMMALWTLGAIYVPIDTKLPVARQMYMIETAECATVVDATHTGMEWSEALPYSHLLLSLPSAPANRPIQYHTYTATDLAYIIFTSGTTGQPKGVPIYYHGLMSLVQQDQLHMCPGIGTRLLHTMGVGFDGNIYVALLGLCHHSTLVFNTGDLVEVAKYVDSALLTPSMLNALDPHTHHNLHTITTGGEALDRSLANVWSDLCLLHNAYGPSEATVMSHSVRVHSGQVVTIGKPIANTTCYILDTHRSLVPIGVTGEIYIGGPAVSPGYLHRPDLNKVRFIANPFGDGTLYATGDLGRWLSNGEVECLGRMDDQVKVRGHRIELSEVRNALLATDVAQNVAALVVQKQLVAFVSPNAVDTTHLFHELAILLPQYMVPSHIVPIMSIPMTANGKVDNHALKATFGEYQTHIRKSAPPNVADVSPQGRALQQAVCAVLRLNTVDVHLSCSFNQLGGDSISAIQLSSHLRRSGYTLSIPAILQRVPLYQLSKEMAPVLALASESTNGHLDTPLSCLDLQPSDVVRLQHELSNRSLNMAMVQTVYPLLPNLWGMLAATAKRASTYANQFVISVNGLSSIAQIEQAIVHVVNRHEALRSRFVLTWCANSINGMQVILNSSVPIDWTQASDWKELGVRDEAEYLAYNESRGIDVDSAMLRFTAVGAPPDDVRLVMMVHHAILDGWSYGLLLQELLQLLNAPMALQSLDQPVSLRHFIACRTIHDPRLDQAYWQTFLHGLRGGTILALPKPSAVKALPAVYRGILYADFSYLQTLATQHELTAHCLFIATWALVLQVYTGQDDVVFGNTVSGRAVDMAQVDRLVGCMVNVVPFRVCITPNCSVLGLLQSIRDDLVATVAHEHCHLSEIQQWVKLDCPVANLFNTVLAFESFPFDLNSFNPTTVGLHSLKMQGQDDYSCAMAIEPHGSELHLILTWDNGQFDELYIQHLASCVTSCLKTLVECLASNELSQQVMADASIFCHSNYDQLWPFNCGPTTAITTRTVLDMFYATVERTPKNVAIEHGGTTWTYQQLFQHVQATAAFLVGHQIVLEEPVGILVQRVPNTIAALIGVLWAGAAFVPIDPTQPLDRITFLLQDCGIRCMLYHAEDTKVAIAVGQRTQCAVHAIGEMLQSPSLCDTISLNHPTFQPSHLAFILYTSGSTGRPKGVMIEHRGLSNLVQQTLSILPHTRSHFRHMQALAMTFDACIWDTFMTLCNGGTLVLHDDIALTLHSVDSAILTPSLMAVLNPAQYPNLKTIIVGGERLPPDVASNWAQHRSIINVYGPTETTIIATIGQYQSNTIITIGRPIHNAEIHILDANLRPVPIGALGELYIGGPGVMRGYVNRPDLDAKALVTRPCTPDKRMFKTGDLGRWLANGEIECLGRQDDQVKIRGMRLELQEIEAVLLQCPAVTMAAVLVLDNALYAFACPAEVEEHVAKAHLSSQLPAYMVPVRIMSLDAIPLTVNGKANKRALLETISQLKQQPAPRRVLPPQTPTQATIREAMAVALSIDPDTIGIHDAFFTLGGDSLSAIQFTGLCREKGLAITISQVFAIATVAGLAQVCHDENPESRSLEPALATTPPPSPFALLNLTQDALDHVHDDAAQQLSVAPTAIADLLPASSLQSGFIVNTLKDPSAYMVQQSYCITGTLDVDRYRECWDQVSQHHSILRTKFVTTDSIPGHTALQVVLATMDAAWSYDESHVLIDADFEHSYFAADRQHGFAFDGSPLIRMALFKTTDTEHWLFLTFHHALLDAWSTNIVLDEVLALYHKQQLHPALQYNTYLAHVMRKPAEATQAFWRHTLNDVKPTPDVQLPSVRPPSPAPPVPSYEYHKQSLSCPLSDIHAFSQRLGITTNNLLRGLWALLLSRYLNEQAEVTFGVLVSGRNEPLSGIDDMVGLSINTVPFRATFQHDQPLHDWLQGIHRLSGEIMAHEHASLVDIQKWAGVPADTPLFQSLLVYDKFRENAPSLSDRQIQCTAHDGVNFTEYPLTISFADVGNELHIVLMHAAHKYDAAYIALICDYLDACLTWVVQSTPEAPVESMWQLPASECSAITTWSQGEERTLDPSCQLLPDLFLNSLSRTPDAIALESGSKRWTYAEVHQHALVIAQWLVIHQVQPGDRVALVFKRSPYFVFAVLAVLLVGGVYTPIEATIATERICNILIDLGKPVTLLQSYNEALAHALLPATSQLGYCDDIVTQSSSTLPPVLPPPQQPHDLAYIIFTSGTTGKPKGVPIRHKSAVNILIHLAQTMELKPDCRFLQLLNMAFDGCLIELFSTLYAGGTIVLSTTDIPTDLHCANACFLTPSLLAALNPHNFPNVRNVISGGEALPWEVANKWHGHCPLYHAYGPTEITVVSNIEPFDPALAVCFSQPIPNTQCYVLDAQQRPVPIGVAGEICIAGLGVSSGYLNRPDLTAKTFVPSPFGPGQMYLTGDLGCWLPNGKIKYLGRKDFQVKLRGFRIELDEVVNILSKYNGVQHACAVVQDSQIIGYVSPKNVNPQAIISFAKALLPRYMVPAAIVPLDALPLTRIGKVDRKALPRHTFASLSPDASTIPRTPIEDQLIRMVAQVLTIPQETMSPHDSFFQLGGDSLSAIRLSAHCRDQGFKLVIPRLFERPILSDIAEYALEVVGAPSESIGKEEVIPFALLNHSGDDLEGTLDMIANQLNISRTAIEDVLPTSSLQEGFVINTLKDPSAYMVQQVFDITGDLDVERYHNAWCAVCNHHVILRTKFAVTDRIDPYASLQVVTAHCDIAWHFDDSPGVDCSDLAAFKQAWLARDRAQGFYLDGSPLIRLALATIEHSQHVLFLSFHHALLDAWSVGLVLHQVLAVYHGQVMPPTLPYAAFIHHTSAQDPKAYQTFWQSTLEGVKSTPAIQLPWTTPISEPMKIHATHRHTISTPIATIQQFCHQQSITLNTLIRAVWAIVLARYLDERDEVTFGTLVSGRNVPLAGIDQMVGLTINTVPFRAKLDLDAPIHAWLAAMHEQSTAIMTYEHASLVDIMHWAHATPEQPLFGSLLVYTPTHAPTRPQYEQTIQQVESTGYNATEYPLVASFGQDDDNLVLSLQYACAKYDSTYMQYLASYVDHCIVGIVCATDSTPLTSLFSLPRIESQHIEQWAHGEDRVLDSAIQYLDELFTRNLDQRPDAIALESGDQQWTYAEVHRHAAAIANHLQEHGVTHQSRVALVFTRSPHFVFSLLAVLMLSATFTPIDAAHGTERVVGILNDLDNPLVLTASSHVDAINGHVPSSPVLCVDQLHRGSQVTLQPPRFNQCRSPSDLAYIIFTSGTTGKPKGVQIRHESAVHILIHLSHTMDLGSNCRFLQLLNIAFDGCLVELFSTFYGGGTVVLSNTDIFTDLHRVNTCVMTPSLLSVLDPIDYPNIQQLIVGGEATPWEVASKWHGHSTLFHAYGPTEITIISNIEPFDPTLLVCISQPVPNTQCYILDPQLRLVPVGIAGEICIAGIGLSNGYLNRPDLTAKAFVSNPFGNGRMYLTGDLGCWLPNGKIKYLGRKDHQVKLRGFRIELGEVEQAIMKHPLVTAACAITQNGNLVAFITPSACDPLSITQLISQSLPPYMVPAAIVPLDALPLTRIGKVDRKALPRIDFDELYPQDIVPPQTPAETVLVGMLAEVLRLNGDQISTGSTFFQLGGNSLTAIRLVAKCQQQGFVLAMADINRTYTIAQLAKRMESHTATADREPYPIISGPVRLTPIQREFLAEDFQWPQAYQSPFLFQCSTAYARSTWQHVVAELLSYHDMLRFHLTDEQDSLGASMGVIEPSLDISRVLDFCEAATEADLHAVAFESCAKLDYRAGPICQFRVITMQQQQFFLSVVHHLAFDLVSSTILMDDVVSLLQNEPLPPKTFSYVAWSDTLYTMAQDLDVSTIALPTPSPALPLDYPHVPLNRSKEYEAKEILTIDGDLLHRFNAYTQQHTVTAVDLLMTALLLACNQHFNMPSITVAFESNGRSPPGQSCDVSRTLGWCVSHNYLSLTKQFNESPKVTLERTQSTLRDLPVNGFNLFLAKHLKLFTDPSERAQFNTSPEMAFTYSDGQAFQALDDTLPIKPCVDLIMPIMSQLLPNAHPYALVVACLHATDKLEIHFTYHTNQFNPSTIQQLVLAMEQALGDLVE